jgi:hypothetical protein
MYLHPRLIVMAADVRWRILLAARRSCRVRGY